MSYARNGSGAEIIEENNFYPFGLKHEGYNALIGNPSYNYQYNGKELQKETGWSDYGARMYMADIGRWGVIDPLAETSRRFTPYNYALNNPVMFIDPDGRKAYSPEPVEMVQSLAGAWGYFATGGSATWGSFAEFLGQDNLFYQSASGSGGGGGNSSGTFDTQEYRDIMTYLAQPEYFQGIDFSQFLDDNEEEPVNFFGKTGEDAPFYQKYKEMYNMFKNTKGDGIFRVYGHGGYGTIWDGESEVYNAEKFDTLMNARNENWKNVDKIKDAILILYICRSATDYPDLKKYRTFGQKVSLAHPNLTVIAFDEYVTYDNSVKGIRNVNKNQNTGDGLGSIIFYRNGEVLKRQAYKEF